MTIVMDASGNVLMYSYTGSPSADVGQTALDLTADQQTACLAAMAASPNGVNFNGQTFTPIAAPVLPPPPVLTVDQKLAAIGLTVSDIQGAIVEAQTKSPVAIPDPNTGPAP
jgi:hypothetical protein